MKKFEELDKLQQEVKAVSEPTTVAVEGADALEQEAPLNQSQLEELFKRTSAFTVKATTQSHIQPDELDDIELWNWGRDGSDGEWDEEEYFRLFVFMFKVITKSCLMMMKITKSSSQSKRTRSNLVP